MIGSLSALKDSFPFPSSIETGVVGESTSAAVAAGWTGSFLDANTRLDALVVTDLMSLEVFGAGGGMSREVEAVQLRVLRVRAAGAAGSAVDEPREPGSLSLDDERVGAAAGGAVCFDRLDI